MNTGPKRIPLEFVVSSRALRCAKNGIVLASLIGNETFKSEICCFYPCPINHELGV